MATAVTSAGPSANDAPIDKTLMVVTPATFAAGPLKERLLIAFLILSESGKTIRTLYTNPSPKHVVTNRFPVQKFAFPTSPGSGESSLSFTFVLTCSDGERVYGHTLHTASGDAVVCLSAYPWCGFFQHVMHAFRVNGAEEHGKRMIRMLLECRGADIPRPGVIVNVPIGGRRLLRPMDDSSAYIDCAPGCLLQIFSVEQLSEVVAALLVERRVVVLGPTFGTVSHVMMALLAVLAPFEWEHVLVPSLPEEMSLVLSSPIPFFVGLVKSQEALLTKSPTDSLVIVRLEARDSTRPSTTHCVAIEYVGEEPVVLPNARSTTSRMRWQLQLLKVSNRYASLLDGQDPSRYQLPEERGLVECDQQMCHIFLDNYASWLGPVLAKLYNDAVTRASAPQDVQRLVGERDQEGRGSKSDPVVPSHLEGFVARSSSEKRFFELLKQSQSFTELMERLSDELVAWSCARKPVAMERKESTVKVLQKKGALNPRPWYEDPLLVKAVRSHAHLFPLLIAELRAATPPRKDRNGSVQGMAGETTASDRRRSQSAHDDVGPRVNVRSLLLRTLSCCTSNAAHDDLDGEMQGVTPSSADH